ncbi:MAG: dihydroorotate dehydrogenase electron transfer subunit [Muribaculaceae bacterium]|nr:dihydroorotate dehydrogenase electron transfer subunit [Muribaculaceae bacterium]
MKKLVNMEILENVSISPSVNLLSMRPLENGLLPLMQPGQFANIEIDCKDVFLRRPISICDYIPARNIVKFAVRRAGKGTEFLASSKVGSILNILLPLGNGFTLPGESGCNILLIGGGVGSAPLLLLAKWLKSLDVSFEILLGAKTADEVILKDEFDALAHVHVSTDDGSLGSQGYVHFNPVLQNGEWNQLYVCGPMPMMRAVSQLAREKNIACQVSLENKMACGMGACLCCVEDTIKGNRCTCVDGPVFDINSLKW